MMRWREYQALQRVQVLGEAFVSYVDQGTGEPLVLLHGIPTWGYLWHRLLQPLSARYRVLIPDLLGYGYSDKRDRFDRSIERQAELVRAWLARLGIDAAHLIAHDIGGGVALRLAAFRPELVRTLCLMNSVCYDSWPIEAMLQLGHPQARAKISAATALTLLRQALKRAFARTPAHEVLEGLLAPYGTEVGKLSLVRNAVALNTNHTTELTPRLSTLNIPTLILWGEDDGFQPVDYGERLAWDLPLARLVRIPDARHFVMLDAAERVEREIQRFLEQQMRSAKTSRIVV